MDPTKVNNKKKAEKGSESKVGTWISVGIVGLFILITYFVVYGLYMARI